MLRSWVLGGLCGLLLASVLRADPGTVTTKDGQTFSGEITLHGDQVIVDRKGIKTTLARDDIRTIVYAASIEEEYRRRHERLARYDVGGRLELAQWLLENKAYSLAQDVLEEARQVQPRNPQVLDMVRIVQRQSELDARQARKKAPVEVATITDNPSAPAATVPASQPAGTPFTRLLTAEEINFVRQEEWRNGDQVSVRFLDDVRRNYVTQERREPGSLDPAAFNRLTALQQAWLIIKSDQDRHTDQLRKEVILGDPPVMRQFRVVQRSLLAACAACHGSDKTAGSFLLRWPANTDADTYTNFIILQKYSYKVGDRTYRMIDRDHPPDSLLIQFALPLTMAVPAHPNVMNYKGAVKTTTDNRLRMSADWIASLNPIVPDYSSIDVGGAGPTSRPANAK